MKYGDAVVFVQKLRDGSIRRANAIVLGSSLHAVKDQPAVEHVDLAFPVLSLAPDGQVLKTRNLEEIFRPSYDVAPWSEDAWVGYECIPVQGVALTSSGGLCGAGAAYGDASEEIARLRQDLHNANGMIEQLSSSLADADRVKSELGAEVVRLKSLPSAADLDAAATEHTGGETVQVIPVPDTKVNAEGELIRSYAAHDTQDASIQE